MEMARPSAGGGGECVQISWPDTMAYIVINYSWHLSLPRGTVGVGDNAGVHLRARVPWSHHGSQEERVEPERPPGKEIPGIPLSLRPPGCGGRQVSLQLITKLERLRVSAAADRPQRDRNRWERYDSVCWFLFTKLLSHLGEAEECIEHSGGKSPGRNYRLLQVPTDKRRLNTVMTTLHVAAAATSFVIQDDIKAKGYSAIRTSLQPEPPPQAPAAWHRSMKEGMGGRERVPGSAVGLCWALNKLGLPRPGSLLADGQAACQLFVCVHGKWGGVAAATALGPSISVTGDEEGVGVCGMCHL
ncbi:unnamed protein product [Pleuronectes platessa]|uniref:Uncharacterized protein n=1 Tax=Pleuronectes platessa TaxID=8262 RepID=A0A9N7VLJ7_PLEPL|nr:unnamed protein product [Pleuronectes platessa]